jgi:hypothetical protein
MSHINPEFSAKASMSPSFPDAKESLLSLDYSSEIEKIK